MPFTGRDAVVICLLLFCVPVQYWLTQYSPINPDQRAAEVYRLAKQARSFMQKWFTISSWEKWLIGVHQKYMAYDYSHWYDLDDDDPEGECPAVEVWIYRNPEGSFGMSPKPRNIRPQGVKWHVGQVVKHKLWGYKGVIIGWDPKSKAPEEWIRKMHQDNKHWREQPNYALLVDSGDPEVAQITYVPQENISPITNTMVDHPDLNQYFDFFDGIQYIPSPWLKAVYPRD